MKKLVRDSKDYKFCECGGYIITDYEWLGEDSNGRGKTRYYDSCEDCGASYQYVEKD